MDDALFLLIVERSAGHYGVPPTLVLSRLRTRPVVSARQLAMWLIHKTRRQALIEIARRFGATQHTTVRHALRVVEDRRQRLPEFAAASSALLEVCRELS